MAEVVVVDGGSEDRTPEVVRSFEGCFRRLIFRQRESRVGIDQDIAWMVSLASGDYCWLMSDDDRLEPGAVAAVMEALEADPALSGISVNYQAYDVHLQHKVRTTPAAIGGRLIRDTLFEDAPSLFGALGLHLGYMPAQIIKRELWGRVATPEEIAIHDGSLWLMTYMIGRMAQAEPRWLYLERVCVATRTSNDSFIEDLGVLRRQAVTHEGFLEVVRSLFGPSHPAVAVVRKGTLQDRVARTLAVQKANGASLALQRQLFQLHVKVYGRDARFWIRIAPLFLVPNFIFSAARRIYLRRIALRERD